MWNRRQLSWASERPTQVLENRKRQLSHNSYWQEKQNNALNLTKMGDEGLVSEPICRRREFHVEPSIPNIKLRSSTSLVADYVEYAKTEGSQTSRHPRRYDNSNPVVHSELCLKKVRGSIKGPFELKTSSGGNQQSDNSIIVLKIDSPGVASISNFSFK